MAYSPLSYTTGNWTVTEPLNSTVTENRPTGMKPIEVRNIVWSTDMSLTSGSTDESAECVSRKNTTMLNALKVTLNKSKINNIYESVKAFSKDAVQRLAKKDGFREQIRVDLKYRAVNSVSGEEGDIISSAWVILQTQNHPAVTMALNQRTLQYALGALSQTDKTSEAIGTDSIFSDMLKGDLDPTK